MSSDSNIHTTKRRGGFTMTRRRKATVAVGAAIAVASPGLAAADIVSPPPAGMEIVVFPERDFVVTEGGPAGQAVRFQIIRNGVTIGTSSSSQVTPALLTDDAGLLEVNHPGGLCWQGVTPNILPGDVLRVTDEAAPANGFDVTTQGVRATSTEIVGSNVVVRGVALLNGSNTPLPLNRVEQRIVQPDFREPPEPLEKRDIRATTDDGNLVRDPAVNGGFIATHSGLTAVQRQKAIAGQTRVLGWQRTAANGDRLGITIWEEDEPGGPGLGGCPQGADYAITAFNQKSIKAGTRGLTVSGTANDATEVRITLVDDAARTTNPSKVATLSAGAPKTFRASFTARQLRKLSDGRVRAVGSYTVGGTPITGVVKSLVKDLKAPRPATSDTRSGAFRGAQSVSLFRAAGEPRTSRIFYTTNGGKPGLGSLQFRRPIRITSTKTLRAVVIDRAGNKSVSNCRTHRGCWRIAIR
jgi:large repetitive protein